MKKLILCLTFTIISICLYSQDLLVTKDGDTLNCRITKVRNDYIYFTFRQNHEFKSTLIEAKQVKKYQYSYFQNIEVPKEKLIGYREFNHFRLTVNGGWSFHTAKVSDQVSSDFKNYVEKLKKGYNLGGDITYYFTEQYGCGIRFNHFNSSNSINIYQLNTDGSKIYGVMKDNININFIAPSMNARILTGNKKNAFLMSWAFGYLDYTDDQTAINNQKITGNTLGFEMDFGLDIGLSKHYSMGIQLSWLVASLSQIEMDDGITKKTINYKKNNHNNLSRIDLSIGLRFNK